MSKEENNKAILRHQHVEELFNKGNLAIADEIISLEYVFHGPMGEMKGPEGIKQIVTAWRTTFPDGHYTIDDMVAEGDKVAVRYTMTGTFKGEYMGIAPTGKKANLTSAIFYRFKGGKEVEATSFSDSLIMYQQLGIPIPQQ
jgi:predicted ester cyclase